MNIDADESLHRKHAARWGRPPLFIFKSLSRPAWHYRSTATSVFIAAAYQRPLARDGVYRFVYKHKSKGEYANSSLPSHRVSTTANNPSDLAEGKNRVFFKDEG